MPLADVAWVLNEVRGFCQARGLTIDGYPMHEVAAHPQAAQVMRLFHDLWGLVEEPVPTTGVPLVSGGGAREFLETLRQLGTSTLWFAVHGAGEVHDRAVLRQGAYRESLRAMRLAREAGMRAGCNLFLTKENIHQFERMVADLQDAGVQEIAPDVYSFVPNARGRASEPLRLEWPGVEPILPKLGAIPETALWRQFWYELPIRHTEAWYVSLALSGEWPIEPVDRLIWLVCRPNLDIFRGVAGRYVRRYGNLRRDGSERVLGRAVADGAASDDELRFTPEQTRPVGELAAAFGRPDSQRIHMHAASMRRWWLDCARRNNYPSF
jgi:hypothetical protein